MSPELNQLFVAWVPYFVRAFGMLAVLPLGDASFAAGRKALLAFGLSLLAFEPSLQVSPHVPWTNILSELAIGLLLGVPCACLVTLGAMLGDLFDTCRGQSVAAIYDPLQESYTTPTAQLVQQLVWVQLLALGVLAELVVEYRGSFALLNSATGLSLEETSQKVLTMLCAAASGCLNLFGPFAILMLMIEVLHACITRAAPGVTLSTEAMQLKSYLGFFLLLTLSDEGLPWAVLRAASHPLTTLLLP